MLKESLIQSGGEMFLFLLFFSMEDEYLVKKFLIPKCIIFSDINNTKVKFHDDLHLHYKNKRSCKAYQKFYL